MQAVANLYRSAGSTFVLAIFFFTLTFINVPLQKRANRKMLETFIPRMAEEPKVITPDK
jgi:hypothetical protein